MSLFDVSVTEKSLDFGYTIVNGTRHNVYIINELFHRRGPAGFLVDVNVVYASLEPGPILRLKKQLMEVPEFMGVEAPETPYVTPIEAGHEFSESLQLTFPIEPKDPYLPQDESEIPHLISQFSFTLGYVIEDKPLEVKPATLPTGTQHLRPWYSDVVQRQRLKTIGPLAAEVLVAIDLTQAE